MKVDLEKLRESGRISATALAHGRVKPGDNALVLAGAGDRDSTTAANAMRVVTVR